MLKDILGHSDIKHSLNILKNNLPNLILFTGPKGVGKKHSAINLIDEIYKGSFSHRLLTHPDILVLESDTSTFKLELVSRMKDFISETSFELNKKFVILRDVDTMNKESVNACLKIFEDSPKNTHFILLAKNKELIINTIISRSTSFEFSPIKDLKKYIPSLTAIEVKIMGGCIGNKSMLSNIEVDIIYHEINLFLTGYLNLDYAKIIDWYLNHKGLDISLLNTIFLLVSQDFAKSNKLLNISLLFIKSCKEFKDKIPSNIKLDMHFKNMLIQNKYMLDNIKYPKIN